MLRPIDAMRTRGYIDGVFGSAVRGWVVDLDAPDTPLKVALRFDGVEHRPVLADERRDDLARAGIGTGVGGFRVSLRSVPAAGEHEIVAVVEGTEQAIPLSPDFRVIDRDGRPRTGVELHEPRDPIPDGVPSPAPQDPTAAPSAGSPGPTRPARDATLAGEHGWLFSCPRPGFGLLRGVERPDPQALSRVIDRVRMLQSGSASLTVVVPDKLFVYPEHTPPQMPVFPAGRLAERLAAWAQDDDDARVLDLLPVLVRARAHGRLFSPASAAPTPLGAFHAYRAIAKALAPVLPGLAPCPVSAVQPAEEQAAPTDLVGPQAFAWRDGRLAKAEGVPAGSATRQAGLAGAVPPSGASTERLVIHHDPATRPVADLLAMHADPGALVETDRLTSAGSVAAQPAVAIWLVSDATLASLVASDDDPDSG
jgi:hypothetical protein